MSLLHDQTGREALAAACAEPDPGSLGAATRLRQRFSPELAAEALAQARLRQAARTKFGERAGRLFLTADGLEQATRPAVARWRARRLHRAGVRRVVDLGCGIGADAMAVAAEGIEVVGVELDPSTAAHARANLATVQAGAPTEVLTGDAVQLAPSLLAGAGPETCVFVDPARRTERGRTWRVEAFTPPWDFVLGLVRGAHSSVVKLGPGVPKQLLPDDVEALWVAEGHDVVECSLWRLPGAGTGHGAVLLGDGLPDDGLRLDREEREPLGVAPVGRYLFEPHGAAIRAGVLDQLLPDAWLLDPQVAYLSGDVAHGGEWFTTFEVLEVLDNNPKVLKAWVREHRVGVLEIKKRALDVDPAALRRRLAPRGPNSATLVLARTPEGSRALVVRRLDRGVGTRLEGVPAPV